MSLLLALAIGWGGAAAQQKQSVLRGADSATQISARFGNGIRSMQSSSANLDAEQGIARMDASVAPRKVAPNFGGDLDFLKGCLIYSNLWEMPSYQGNTINLYKFPVEFPMTFTSFTKQSRVNAYYGGVLMGDKYLAISPTNFDFVYLSTYDTNSWAESYILVEGVFRAMDMAYDDFSSTIYGCFVIDGKFIYGTLDPSNGSINPIATQTEANAFNGIDVAKDGTMYAITTNGDFGTVEKTTGAFTKISSTGLKNYYTTSAAINHDSGIFYYVLQSTNHSYLYSINPADGKATLLYEMPNWEQFMGLYFDNTNAEINAPRRPTINEIKTDADKLTANISFTTPDKLFGNDSVPGVSSTMRYEVYANDQIVRKGDGVNYGHKYNVPFEVPAAGMYEIKLVVYNENGASPVTSVMKWIGADAPMAPAPVLGFNENKDSLIVTWPKVEQGQHNGYISNVTYSVYSADGAELATGLTGTQYKEPIKGLPVLDLTYYSFFVKASAKGGESDKVQTNTVSLGAIATPYSGINPANRLDGWTIVDANGNGKTWEWTESNGTAYLDNYISGKKSNNDDWLISPSLKVEAGKQYAISFKGWPAGSGQKEDIELYVGTEASPAGMTQLLLAQPITFQVNNGGDPAMTVDYIYHCTQSGIVNFGIRACSEEGFRLWIKNFNVKVGMYPQVPNEATDLNVIVPYDGTKKATLSFVAPAIDVAGNKLTSLSRVEVLVDGKIISTINDPIPGAFSSVEYVGDRDAEYTFSVVAYNDKGEGMTTSIKAFLGISTPGIPKNVKITLGDKPDMINIQWEPCDTDIYGYVMNPKFMKYNLFQYAWFAPMPEYPTYYIQGWVKVASDIDATEFKGYQPQIAESFGPYYAQQGTVRMGVTAYSSTGYTGDGGVSNSLIVGNPYKSPFDCHFTNAVSQFAYVNLTGNAQWNISRYSAQYRGSDGQYYYLLSRQDDGGLMYMSGMAYGAWMMPKARMLTGRFEIAENDKLSFYYFGVDNFANELKFSTVENGDTTEFKNLVLNQLDGFTQGSWNRAVIDLNPLAGKTVQFVIEGTLKGMGNTQIILDDIRLADTTIDHDLQAGPVLNKPISAVQTEDEFVLGYQVTNYGSETVEEPFTVSLYCNGALVETVEPTSYQIPSGYYMQSTFSPLSYSIFETGKFDFYYTINYSKDQITNNNTSNTETVEIIPNSYPKLTIDTDYAAGDSVVKINWQVPTIDETTDLHVVENFESSEYPAFGTKAVGGWNILNFNQTPTWGVRGLKFPEMGTPFGWILFDPQALNLTEEDAQGLWGCDGAKFMASFGHENGANDAWLISPYMAGKPQTVTFMGRAVTDTYAASQIEVLWARELNDTTDFNVLTRIDLTDEWAQYAFDMPENAHYFALRTVSNNYLIMVDKVEYTYDSDLVGLYIDGYDLYRDDEIINTELIPNTATEYVDAASEGMHEYYATVKYNNDKHSMISNTLTVDVTLDGIGSVESGATKVSVNGHVIVVEGAESTLIAAIDGKLVYNGNDQLVSVEVATGVYIVKTNDVTVKVIVK